MENTCSTRSIVENENHCGFQVQDRYLEDGNDKMKLLVLLCGEDDEDLQIAAAGGLAMLTAAQKKLCTKLTKVVRRTHVTPDENTIFCLFLFKINTSEM